MSDQPRMWINGLEIEGVVDVQFELADSRSLAADVSGNTKSISIPLIPGIETEHWLVSPDGVSFSFEGGLEMDPLELLKMRPETDSVILGIAGRRFSADLSRVDQESSQRTGDTYCVTFENVKELPGVESAAK